MELWFDTTSADVTDQCNCDIISAQSLTKPSVIDAFFSIEKLLDFLIIEGFPLIIFKNKFWAKSSFHKGLNNTHLNFNSWSEKQNEGKNYRHNDWDFDILVFFRFYAFSDRRFHSVYFWEVTEKNRENSFFHFRLEDTQ